MGNITMVDGHVPDGSYQNVTANGSCSCDAGMRFDGLRARGSFDAMGLDGGNVHCEGRLICRGDMQGTLDADELRTERLRMTPLSSAMFGRSGMTEFTQTSNAERIIGGDLRVSRLICTLMQGVFIRLTDESHVERASCITKLAMDSTSSVLLVSGAAKRVYLRNT